MSSPLRVPWATIKQAIEDEDCVLILNRRFLAIIASIADRLEWEATYRTDEYDYQDWDELQRLIAQSQSNIGDVVNLADLLSSLTDILTAINQIQGTTNAGACCDIYERQDFSDGAQYTDEVVDGVGSVPQNIIDAGYATDANDWTGYAEWKCMVANIFVDNLIDKCVRFNDLATTLGAGGIILASVAAIAGTIIALGTGGGVVLLAGIVGNFAKIAGLFAGVGAILGDELEDAASDLETHRSDIVCSIYNSDGTLDAISSAKGAISANLSQAGALAVNQMMIDDTLRALLGSRYDQTDIAGRLAELGYDPADYDCTDCGGPPQTWDYDEDFSEGTANDLTTGGFSFVSYTPYYFEGKPGATSYLTLPTIDEIQARYGQGSRPGPYVVRMQCDVYGYGQYFGNSQVLLRWQTKDTSGTWQNRGSQINSSLFHNQWYTWVQEDVSWFFKDVDDETVIRLREDSPGGAGDAARLRVDNIRFTIGAA